MPSITILETQIGAPAEDSWSDTRVFLGPNRMQAVFHDPFEFRMGAYGWKLKLLREARDVTPFKLKAKARGFGCPWPYQPWSNSGERLLLATWKREAFFYDLASKKLSPLSVKGFLVSALGSRSYPRFVAVTTETSYLVSTDGDVRTIGGVSHPAHEYPEFRWFDAAEQFFAIENLGWGRANLRFFAADAGEPQASIPFAPSEVFPYDEHKYAEMNRDTFGLVLSASSGCVVALLDQWSGVEWDEATGTLRMRVYRPVGEIYRQRGLPVCKVEEARVTAQLRP